MKKYVYRAEVLVCETPNGETGQSHLTEYQVCSRKPLSATQVFNRAKKLALADEGWRDISIAAVVPHYVELAGMVFPPDIAEFIRLTSPCEAGVKWLYGMKNLKDAWEHCFEADWLIFALVNTENITSREACLIILYILRNALDGQLMQHFSAYLPLFEAMEQPYAAEVLVLHEQLMRENPAPESRPFWLIMRSLSTAYIGKHWFNQVYMSLWEVKEYLMQQDNGVQLWDDLREFGADYIHKHYPNPAFVQRLAEETDGFVSIDDL